MTRVASIPALSDLPFRARGPLSAILHARLASPATDFPGMEHLLRLAGAQVEASDDIARDDDIQLSLFLLYALHYGSLPGIVADHEWEPDLIRVRRVLEQGFEAQLRTATSVTALPRPVAADVAEALFALTAADTGPSVSRFFAKKADLDQAHEFLIQRSIYNLREADPHSWGIPRLSGRAKAALVEIQSDEYGGGRPQRMHATLYAQAMRGAGLDDAYGAYVEDVPAITLASMNMMSMFGLNRRLVGALVGHLAAFEMTSSIPNRFYAEGLRRLGFGSDVTEYFDEHVEADAVHEQIAAHDLAGSLAEDAPELLPDVMFGARACLMVDGWAGEHILERWTAGVSSLRTGTVATARKEHA